MDSCKSPGQRSDIIHCSLYNIAGICYASIRSRLPAPGYLQPRGVVTGPSFEEPKKQWYDLLYSPTVCASRVYVIFEVNFSFLHIAENLKRPEFGNKVAETFVSGSVETAKTISN